MEIHIYLDGQGIGITTANQYRPDVNNVYGCGDYHGYDAHFEVDQDIVGEHTLDVYAINIGGGKNTLIGESKVNIIKDIEAPVISDYKVTTWTQKDGQDDIIQDWSTNATASGTRNGDTYTYQVNIADHNNESGLYNTHIYAYDKYGNYAFRRCEGLQKVEFSDNLNIIGECAFYGCSNLSELILPERITEIGANAYYPGNNATWTKDKLKNYGGTLTWKQN